MAKREKKLPAWVNDNLPKELVESTLFRFEVMLQADDTTEIRPGVYKKRRITVDMLPELDLDYDILEQQLQDIPAQYAFWAAVYSECRMWVALQERALKAAKGQAVETVKRKLAQDGINLTAEQVKNVIEADKTVVNADVKLQKLQMQAGKLYHMIEALKMKAELARSLAGFKRQEYSNPE